MIEVDTKVLNIRKYVVDFVQREDTIRWAKEHISPTLPKYEKTEIVKDSPGMFNLLMDTLIDLKP